MKKHNGMIQVLRQRSKRFFLQTSVTQNPSTLV